MSVSREASTGVGRISDASKSANRRDGLTRAGREWYEEEREKERQLAGKGGGWCW